MTHCSIDLIREIQEAFTSLGFKLFCTSDEDEGLHIANAQGMLGTTDVKDTEEVNQLMLEYLERGYFSMVRKDNFYFALNDTQKKWMQTEFVKFSSKRETLYIDWEFMYDNH